MKTVIPSARKSNQLKPIPMAEFVSSNNSHTEERFLVFDEQGFLVGSFSSLAEVYDYRKAAREDEDLNNR